MNVLYDHQIFSAQRQGGVSKYFTELCTELSYLQSVNVRLALNNTTNTHLLGSTFAKEICGTVESKYLLEFDRFFQRYPYPGAGQFFYMWNRLFGDFYIDLQMMNESRLNRQTSLHLIQAKNFDIFHPTYYDPYFLDHLDGAKYVVTVHDMIHELFPSYFPDQDLTIANKKKVILNAERIIAVSKKTRNDLVEIYRVDSERVDVVYHGIRHVQSQEVYLPDRFILFVGRRSSYKNFNLAVDVFSRVLAEDNECWLVCCGGGAVSEGERLVLIDLNVEHRVLFLEPTDSELQYIYSKARLLIYPSLAEGFGLPIIEAMSAGCVVCLSDIECFSEIAEDAASYFDPMQVESALESVQRVLSDSDERNRFQMLGLQLAQRYTWRQAAEDTLAVYKSAIGQGL